MKLPLMLVSVAVLASVATVAFDTEDSAFQLYDAAKLVAAAGLDDATAAAYGPLLDEYPYAPFAVEIRGELANLDTWVVSLPEEQNGLPLRDPLIIEEAPWIGPSAVMILGLLLALWLTIMPRTKVRSLAAILLILGLTGAALSQGFIDLSGSEAGDASQSGPMPGAEGLAYAYFPWLAMGVLGAGVLLGLVPRGKDD